LRSAMDDPVAFARFADHPCASMRFSEAETSWSARSRLWSTRPGQVSLVSRGLP
jgi:hypothetical protein